MRTVLNCDTKRQKRKQSRGILLTLTETCWTHGAFLSFQELISTRYSWARRVMVRTRLNGRRFVVGLGLVNGWHIIILEML